MTTPTLMLGHIPGETLFQSSRTLVLRGVHPDTRAQVVLKVLRAPRPTAEQVAWFRREYELLRELADVPGVAHAVAFGLADGLWTLCLEDIGGASVLDAVKSRPLPLDEALRVTARVARTLAELHRRGVVHRDVNPSNIVYHRGTGEVRLIDFGIATRLASEMSHFDAPTSFEGTLAYVSPEQTGRMNRPVDHRSDLYSLGAALFHALTGVAPFAVDDPAELAHAHLARTPPRATALRRDLPTVVADVVDRLLAKSADARYQSADDLADDLDECLRRLGDDGRVETFALDRAPRPVRFTIPERLYGRERETAALVAAFERAAQRGPALTLIAGYSGVGKSSLVRETHAAITARHGTFVEGKFDQYQRVIPYAPLMAAARALVRQVLGESEDRLARWRALLATAVGANGSVLVEVIPELEAVIGRQAPAPEVSASEGQTRFERVFAQFLGVFAQPSHPLAMFLDDLQWVDPGSLRLLESLFLRSDIGHMQVLVAYRDNEVQAGHPLLLALDRLRAAGASIESLELGPVDDAHVRAFVADTVRTDVETARPLADLVLAKTRGNPFFMKEFMRSLHAEGLLTNDRGRWTWRIADVAARDVTDNVIELMTARVNHLTAASRDALVTAALLGSAFDLETLAVALDVPPAAAWATLWPAVADGLVIALDDAYRLVGLDVEGLQLSVRCRFSHDRVQQAARSLAPERDRAAAHARIGRRMLAAWPDDRVEDRLFDVLGHLNAGRSDDDAPRDRDALAALNLRGARKARDSAAFAACHEHAGLGLALLGEDRYARHHDLAIALVTEAVEAAFQCGDFDAMDRWLAEGVAHARTPLEAAAMHEIEVESLNARGRPRDALARALDCLDALGVVCPREPGQAEVGAEVQRAKEALGDRGPDDLAAMPDATDPAVRAAVRIICKIYSSAYVASPYVFVITALRQFQLAVTHGYTPVSPLVFAVYGLLNAAVLGDVHAAYAFGALSDRLVERPDVARFRAQALHLFSCHTRFWREHLRHSVEGERRAWRTGIETGEMEFGCYGGHVATKYAFFQGQELGPLLREAEQYTAAMKRYRIEISRNSHEPWHQCIALLTGGSARPWELAGAVYDADAARPRLDAAGDRMAISNALLARIVLGVVFERFDDALVAAVDEEATYLDAVLSQFNQPVHHLFDGLVRAATCPAEGPARDEALAKLRADRDTLAAWAEASPQNLAQKAALLDAEALRLEGKPLEARERYDDAIRLADAHEFTLDAALACDAAARFHTSRGNAMAARHYRREARDAYARWGALARVAHLEAAHPELADEVSRSRTTTTATRSANSPATSFDTMSVLKASQAIASEVVLSSLLRRLVATLMECSGAARAMLLLDHDGELVIEADGRVDDPDGASLTAMALSAPEASARVSVAAVNYVARTREPLVLDDASRSGLLARDPYVSARVTRSLLCLPIVLQGRLRGLVYLENDLAAGAFTRERLAVVETLAGQIAVSIDNARLYANLEERVRERTERLEQRNRFIREVFGRYLADEVVETLLASPSGLNLGGEKREITVMFSDLRGFTALSDRLAPDALVGILNRYLSEMTRVIQEYQGTIDDFFGDGIMVHFGAPLWRDDHADRAVACALEMQRALAALNAKAHAVGDPELAMGIGINTGEVVVGNVGSAQRAKYSVVGRNVNLAARIESLTVGGQVLISQSTRDAVRGALTVVGEQRLRPKGFGAEVVALEVSAIEGRLRASWSRREASLRPLQRAFTAMCRVVESKEVQAEAWPAAVLRGSAEALELSAPNAPDAPFELLLTLVEGDRVVATEVSAKVSRAHGGVFVGQLVDVPDAARRYLDEATR